MTSLDRPSEPVQVSPASLGWHRTAPKRVSPDYYREMLDSIRGVIWESDADTFEPIFVSAAVERILGYTPEQWMAAGGLWEKVLHPEDRARVVKASREHVRQRRAHTLRYRVLTPGAQVLWIEDIVDVLPQPDGSTRLRGFMLDVTEKKRVEDELRENQDRYRVLLEASRFIPWEFDLERSRYTYVGPRAEEILGYPIADWRRPDFWEHHLHPDDRDRVVSITQQATVRRKDHTFDYRMIAASGEVVWIHDLGTVVKRKGRAPKLRGVMIDMTEQKQTEEELRVSEARYRRMYRSTPVMMHSITPDGKLLSVSDHWCERMGYTREEVLGTEVLRYLTETSQKLAREVRIPQLFHEGQISNVPYQFVTRAGEVRDVLLSATIEHDATKENVWSLAVMVDVTEQKRAEEALRKNEQRYRAVVETQTELVSRCLPDSTLTFVNDAYCRYFMKTREELLGKRFVTFLPESERQSALDHLARLVKTPRRVEYEHQTVLPDGTTAWQQWSDIPVTDDDGHVVEFQSVGRDITHRKHAELALQKSKEHFRLAADTNRRLLDEVNHRVRNNLGSLLALFRITRENVGDLDIFASSMEERIRGMTRVHDLLANSAWAPLSMRGVIDGVMTNAEGTSNDAQRIVADGPDVHLTTRQITPLAMSLLEMLTNSIKYGAHSTEEGRVSLTWQVLDEAGGSWVELRWIESGGPVITECPKRSVGTKLIDGFVTFELGGRCDLRFKPGGARHTIAFPLDAEASVAPQADLPSTDPDATSRA